MTLLPTLTVNMAVATKPTETATWVDITSFVHAVRIRRGRQHELDRTEAGTSQIMLNNQDNRFDPNYSGTLVNLITNPSFESDTSSWSYSDLDAPDTGSFAASAAQAYSGSQSALLTTAATNEPLVVHNISDNLDLSLAYIVSAYFYVDAFTAGSLALALQRTDTFAVLCSTAVDTATVGSWQRVTATYAGGGSGSVGVRVRLLGTNGVGANTYTIYIDAVQVEQASAATTYTDGSLDNCRWSGTAHASTSYRGGPYYGNLLPMRRVQAYMTHPTLAVVYYLFTHYIESWPPSWEGGVNPLVNVSAVDALKVLALYKLNTSYAQEASGTRINNVLDTVGWTAGNAWVLDSGSNSQLGTTTILAPNGDRLIMAGQTTVPASTLADVTALQHVQDVALAENGLFIVATDGVMTFLERHYLYRTVYGLGATVDATFGDAVGEVHYTDLDVAYDDSEIYNEIRMGRTGGTVQTASDTTSQDNYWTRTLAQESLLATTDSEMADRANWMLYRYKDPMWRCKRIAFDFEENNGDWVTWIDLEVGSRITLKRRPSDAYTWEQDYIVEGIEDDIGPGRKWTRRLALSPAPTIGGWTLCAVEGDFYSELSVLGTSTVLGY